MAKFFGYARISTSDQSKYSLAKQQEILEYIAESQYPEHVFEYHPETRSGTTIDGRAVFSKLLECAEAGDVLAVAYHDRFGRQGVEDLTAIKNLQRKGVIVNLGGLVYNPEDPVQAFSMEVQMVTSNLFVNLQKKKAKEGIALSRQSGSFLFRSNLFGYRRSTDKRGKTVIHEDEEQADVVRRIFALLVTGTPLLQIADTLVQEGHLHSANPGSAAARVRKIAMNPIYMGYYEPAPAKLLCGALDRTHVDPKHLVKSTYYPALVTPEQWWNVYHHRRRGGSTLPSVVKHRTRPWETTGIVVCQHCLQRGRRIALVRGLHTTYPRNGGRNHYPIYQSGLHFSGCPMVPKTMKAEVLENLFRCLYTLALSDPSESQRHVAEMARKQAKEENETSLAIGRLERQLETVEKKLDRVVSFVAKMDDADGRLAQQYSELQNEKRQILDRIDEQRVSLAFGKELVESLAKSFSKDRLVAYFGDESSPPKRRKELLSTIAKAELAPASDGNGILFVDFFNGKSFQVHTERAKGKRYQTDFVTEVFFQGDRQGEVLVSVGLGQDDFDAGELLDNGQRGQSFDLVKLVTEHRLLELEDYFSQVRIPLLPHRP